MQGQRSSVSTLPENLSFDHGSTSSDPGIDSQIPWNNMQTSAETRLPDYRIPSSETNTQYLHHIGRSEWCLGETSSAAPRSRADNNERKREQTWSSHSRAALNLEGCSIESSNIHSMDTVDGNGQGNQTSNGPSVMQISGPVSVSQDLNMCSDVGDEEDDECQVIEHPGRHISLRSSNEKRPSTGSSSDSGYMMEDSRRLSCKRKAVEAQVGQSSGAGTSNCFEHAERSQWHAVQSISTTNSNMPTPALSNLVFSNVPEQSNSRARLSVGGDVSSNPSSSNSRNLRLRMSALNQQDHTQVIPLSTEVNAGNIDVPSSRYPSRFVYRNRLIDLNPPPSAENGSHRRHQVLPHIPSVRRNPHSRWGAASSSRTSHSAAIALEREGERGDRERDPMLYEASISGNTPRSISEHPLFVPSEIGGSSQQPTNWNLASGSGSLSGDVAPTSQAGSTLRANSSSPSPFWSHRSHPQYPRRLSEMVRRTLLSAESGGQSSSSAIRSNTPSMSQETALSSNASNTRSALLERHLDGAFGIPHAVRSLAAASERRSSVMSEHIHHVLDVMRRGEGLRIEDMMMLDHSVFFGMPNMHDRHHDMRLDVDNMSYEELLALEDRIGNVCTGLNEETIMSRLKQHKYAETRADQAYTEPCSICQEEYNDGEDVGTLECGHIFHTDCIKQWLLLKNLCPICKTTGLST